MTPMVLTLTLQMSPEQSRYCFSKGTVLSPCLWSEGVWKREGRGKCAMQVITGMLPMEILVAKQQMHEILLWTTIIGFIESSGIWWDFPTR